MGDKKPASIMANSEVIFSHHITHNIPLPNPDFILLHTTLSGVLHVSGVGKDINNIVQDLGQDGNGNGPPEHIFSSGIQFLQHTEACTSANEMLGNTVQLIPVH
jgi:hypothetical protein